MVRMLRRRTGPSGLPATFLSLSRPRRCDDGQRRVVPKHGPSRTRGGRQGAAAGDRPDVGSTARGMTWVVLGGTLEPTGYVGDIMPAQLPDAWPGGLPPLPVATEGGGGDAAPERLPLRGG